MDPVEASKTLRERHRDEKEAADRHARIVQIGEAILLAAVTITAAWAGYAAARWATASSIDLANAASAANLATRDDLGADADRNFDAAAFEAWFIAHSLHDTAGQAVAIRRFRPDFLVAFEAWLATRPFTNPRAPKGPTYMPQYVLPEAAQSVKLDKQADAERSVGESAASTSDEYIRVTVFLAAVLFLVGIGSTFKLHTIRYTLIGVGSVLLVVSVVYLVQLPSLPP